MKFTDIFIRRPVLACVVSLMIVVIGVKSITALPVLEYPKADNAIVTITTTYYALIRKRSPDSSPRRWKTPSPRPTASTI